MAAFTGVVAGFWHIFWIAGAGMLAAGLLAVAVHSAGYTRLERDHVRTRRIAGAPAPRMPRRQGPGPVAG